MGQEGLQIRGLQHQGVRINSSLQMTNQEAVHLSSLYVYCRCTLSHSSTESKAPANLSRSAGSALR